MYRFLVLFFALMSAIGAQAQVQNDFDLDGLSDPTVIEIQSNSGLAWQANLSTSRSTSPLGTLGQVGNHIVLATWTNKTVAELGVIKSAQNSNEVTWEIIDQNNQTRSFSFGTKDGLFVSGADFDNSGYADAAYAVRSNGALAWYIKVDPLLQSGSELLPFSFGKPSDKVFFLNAYGKGDWLAYVRKKANGRSTLFLKNPLTRRLKRLRLRRALAFDTRPFPIKQANGRDFWGVSRKTGLNTQIRVYNLRGKLIRSGSLSANGDLVVGNYLNPSYEQIAVTNQSSFEIFDPVTAVKSSLGAIEGIAIDQININSFSSGDESAPEDGSCSNGDPSDGNEGFLWKPNSDTQYYAVTVMPQSYTGRVKRVDTTRTNGAVIKTLRYKGVGNGNRTTWQDDSLTGSNYKSSYGSILVKMVLDSGACVNYLISDPSRRTD